MLMLFDFTKRQWTWPASSWVIRAGRTTEDFVYLDSPSPTEPAFYRVPITDHKTEKVVSLKGLRRPPSSSNGSWTGLAPDDSPLALRDITSQEIYALDVDLP
jgi:hypothetical protein